MPSLRESFEAKTRAGGPARKNRRQQIIEIVEIPVSRWARWWGLLGAISGFLMGSISLLMMFVAPNPIPEPLAIRLIFGYGAPFALAIICGAFGWFGGAMFSRTYNHFAETHGGLRMVCEVSDVERQDD